jgi:hypothetical protein
MTSEEQDIPITYKAVAGHSIINKSTHFAVVR